MFISNLASVVPSIAGVIANTFGNPGACYGACTNIRDPALIQRPDGKYFRYSTSEKILTASANSLEGPWTAKGSAIPDGSIIDLPGKNILWVNYLHSSSFVSLLLPHYCPIYFDVTNFCMSLLPILGAYSPCATPGPTNGSCIVPFRTSKTWFLALPICS